MPMPTVAAGAGAGSSSRWTGVSGSAARDGGAKTGVGAGSGTNGSELGVGGGIGVADEPTSGRESKTDVVREIVVVVGGRVVEFGSTGSSIVVRDSRTGSSTRFERDAGGTRS